MFLVSCCWPPDAAPTSYTYPAAGCIALAGKAGGFLALDWNDGSPVGPLARHSYALHAQLAEAFGSEAIGYRQLDTIQVGCMRVSMACTVWSNSSISTW
jgi:hypothetical protein